ncbi:MAG: anthranilate phosphoribosyltransferase [candidate division KSB1 bacterium]|nr:anthranilate phosphoribosyltransferase [candidate division KSB1 bacterium]MDZ7336440.1 anthranilate phosphoribosyltransferase [candidate division KSB1 bacterium]MDZ7357149.1 anthranilate phosphoribosyltransferase [candidate division KSB1 bacterium]MDZ7375551.1 anthranilate phosphoribosyltransferase [candidate division KSB1 bacterium]MDZ7400217.1 anthranilate phosphoribosyltransferase [candidate division KSB1 bacterium]
MEFATYLEKLIRKQSLSESEAYDVMIQILSGKYSNEKIAGLLVALRAKGETSAEVSGFVKAMRELSVRVETPLPVVDTCGTGGDGAHTFNISTAAAFIAAGAGVPIAKHHNRSVSSKCGSADVLEALGIDILMPPEKVKMAIETIGIGFCFAPLFHQSMKFATVPRKELGIRTVFNMLGPLLNPCSAKRQVIGVFADDLTGFFADILKQLGSEHVFIVHGEDGLDELTLCGRTLVTELIGDRVSSQFVSPEDFGFQRARSGDLLGGNASENAVILKNLLYGEKGPKRDAAVLNAALAIVCGGLANSIHEGIQKAQESIDSGAAIEKLEQLKHFSQGGKK